jgi:hypothetical protein
MTSNVGDPMSARKARPKATASNYKRTEQDEALISRMTQIAGSAPTIKVVDRNGFQQFSLDHADKTVGIMLLMEQLGTTEQAFLGGLLDQLAEARTGRKVDEYTLNFLLSVVRGIKPKDQTEAMLAAQMAVIHAATMTFARRLANVENIAQQNSAERALNKLARTFAMQMEALKRYRTGGEQKVTVQHVSVQEGGQAIVGNVTHAAAKPAAEKSPASPRLLTESKMAPMEMISKPARSVAPVIRKVKR